MSLGGSGACGTTYQAAIDSAVSRGTTVVVAAGNSNQDASGFRPANCNTVVTVAASNPSGSLSYYSNYGATVDLTAPGGDIQRQPAAESSPRINTGTTTPGSAGYASYQGTSMAAPHVAGLAALMKSKSSSLTPAQVESTLKPGHPGHAGRLHHGLRRRALRRHQAPWACSAGPLRRRRETCC